MSAPESHPRTPFSRRSLLRGLGGAAALGATATVASSCSLFGSPTPSGNSSGSTVTLKIAIVPDPSGASEFYAEQFDTFTAQTGIKVEIMENPTDQQLNAIELMFQQGNAPDVFRCQGPQALDRISGRGWTAALDEYATTSKLADRFPEGALDKRTSGLHRDGKLVSLPLVSGQWSAGLFLVSNTSLLTEAGFSAPPETWSQYEEYARAMTTKGAGDYWGAALFSGIKTGDIRGFQATAGPSSIGNPGIDYRTGKAAVADKSMIDTVEFLRKLQADKVFQPGWEAWDGTRAFTEFAKGKNAMYIGGGWNVNEIAKLNPDLGFQVSVVPVPDLGRASYIGQASAFSPIWSMSSESKHPDEAWKLMDFLVSEEFQAAYFAKFRTFTAVESAWREASDLTEAEQGIITAFDASIRRTPDPQTDGTLGVQKLLAAMSAKPELMHWDISIPAIAQNKDYAEKAAKLDATLEKFLDTEITKINDAGDEVSRDDLIYTDWNPLENWTPSK